MPSIADIMSIAVPQIKREEWAKGGLPPLVAYADPVSKGEPWTIGYGSTGPHIGPGTTWSYAQALTAVETRTQAVIEGLQHAAPDLFDFLDVFQLAALTNMGYQMGLAGLMAFHGMFTAIRAKDWTKAHEEGLNSLWARQTPERAERVLDQLCKAAS